MGRTPERRQAPARKPTIPFSLPPMYQRKNSCPSPRSYPVWVTLQELTFAEGKSAVGRAPPLFPSLGKDKARWSGEGWFQREVSSRRLAALGGWGYSGRGRPQAGTTTQPFWHNFRRDGNRRLSCGRFPSPTRESVNQRSVRVAENVALDEMLIRLGWSGSSRLRPNLTNLAHPCSDHAIPMFRHQALCNCTSFFLGLIAIERLFHEVWPVGNNDLEHGWLLTVGGRD